MGSLISSTDVKIQEKKLTSRIEHKVEKVIYFEQDGFFPEIKVCCFNIRKLY